MSQVNLADAKFNFTKHDKIVILWSGFERFDWITNTHWENYGSVFHAPKERRFWHQRNWSITNDIVRNYTSILSVNKSYTENILWQAHAFDPDSDRDHGTGAVHIWEAGPHNPFEPSILWPPKFDGCSAKVCRSSLLLRVQNSKSLV